MGDTSDLTIQTAAKRLAGRKHKVDDEVDKATKGSNNSTPKKARFVNHSMSASEAKKTEHTGSEGEKSYGQKMKKPAFKNKTRFSTGD